MSEAGERTRTNESLTLIWRGRRRSRTETKERKQQNTNVQKNEGAPSRATRKQLMWNIVHQNMTDSSREERTFISPVRTKVLRNIHHDIVQGRAAAAGRTPNPCENHQQLNLHGPTTSCTEGGRAQKQGMKMDERVEKPCSTDE